MQAGVLVLQFPRSLYLLGVGLLEVIEAVAADVHIYLGL